ncbi:MAG: malate synthase A, partial [Dehalococcoidia bacterium]|nr:malate synthase A [Dehalococcoidia bacterium]
STKLADGGTVTANLVRQLTDEELAKIPAASEEGRRFNDARAIFDEVSFAPQFVEFLTLPAYNYID